VEYGLLVGLAIGMLTAYFTSSHFSTYSYMVLGNVLAVICLVLTILGLVRVGYNVYYKTRERKI
jgi:uncharacterized protein YacL